MPAKTTKTTRTSKKATRTKDEITLTKEVKTLSKEVRKLKKLEFVKILKHPWKFIWMSFLHGLMTGFGWVLGASVLAALFVYLLAQIQLVPFFGDIVTDVIEEVEDVQPILEEKIENRIDVLETPAETPVETPAPTE